MKLNTLYYYSLVFSFILLIKCTDVSTPKNNIDIKKISFEHPENAKNKSDSNMVAMIYDDSIVDHFENLNYFIDKLESNNYKPSKIKHRLNILLRDTNIILFRKTNLGSLKGGNDSTTFVLGNESGFKFESLREIGNFHHATDFYLKHKQFCIYRLLCYGFFQRNGISKKAMFAHIIVLNGLEKSYLAELYYQIPNEALVPTTEHKFYPDLFTQFKNGTINDSILYKVAYNILEKTRKKQGKHYYKTKKI